MTYRIIIIIHDLYTYSQSISKWLHVKNDVMQWQIVCHINTWPWATAICMSWPAIRFIYSASCIYIHQYIYYIII